MGPRRKEKIMEMVIKRQQALRKQGKKGFTLVELIVVIVILGILAAIAVPALVGYIDKARSDGAITEAATARTALQTIMSDAYGNPGDVAGEFTYYGPNGAGSSETIILTITSGVVTWDGTELNDAVSGLTSAAYTDLEDVEINANFEVIKFTITVPGAGETVTFENGNFEVV